jgi:hypothetical protein
MTNDPGSTYMLDKMTLRAKSLEVRQALRLAILVVFPDFMTFNGVPVSFSSTNLTAEVGASVYLLADPIPSPSRQELSEVLEECGARYMFYSQFRLFHWQEAHNSYSADGVGVA